MWAAQQAELARRVPDDRHRPPGARRTGRRTVHARRRGGRPGGRDPRPRDGRSCGRRRPVARWLRRDGPRRARTRRSSAASSCRERRPSRSVPRSLPFLALRAASWTGSPRAGSTASTPGSSARATRRRSPSRSSPAGSGRRAAPRPLRAIAGERFLPRLAAYPGPTLILNGELDVIFRLVGAGLRRGRASTPGGSAWPARRTSPTSIGRPPSAKRSAASPARSRPTDVLTTPARPGR